jgi:hypothetical protein
MKNVSKSSRAILLFSVLLGVLAAAPNCSLTEVVSSVDDRQDDVAGKPLFAIGNEKGKPTGEESDIIAPGWEEFPVAPAWDRISDKESPYSRREKDPRNCYSKAVPAPDGGIYLFTSGLVVGPGNRHVCVEHYNKDLHFVTSPDIGLRLLGFSPYVGDYSVHMFDVMQSGEDYYIAFNCWKPRKPDSIFLMKYDKHLKPLYERPVFIDHGKGPALVEVDGKIYILCRHPYKDDKNKRRYGIFKMTVVEKRQKIDGKDRFFVHRIHRERLHVDNEEGSPDSSLPSVVFHAQRREFCLVYNLGEQTKLWGDHYAQIFSENWEKKGKAVNLSDSVRALKHIDNHDAGVPHVTVHKDQYIFATDGMFKIGSKSYFPNSINAVLLKYDADLKQLAAKPIYCKNTRGDNKTIPKNLIANQIFNYGDGLAFIGVISHSGALLYKMDSNLKVESITLLKGGIPKKAELFIDADTIESYPPKGILGYSQVLNVPVNNRGLKRVNSVFNVEMYYQNKKVASTVINKNLSFAHQRIANLTWTVPENIDQEEIEVQIKIDPEKKIDDFIPANNTLTLKIPVWDKGLVRGYVQDGSLGVINWLPLEGAVVTLTADGYNVMTTTDRIGEYEFERVPYGEYHLKIEKVNYNTLEEDHTLAKRCPVVTLRNKLDNHGRFEVEVKPDKAAEDCDVMLSGGKFTGIDAERAESGKYTADVPAGDYRVKITAPGFVPHESNNVQVRLGQTTTIAVTMEEATFCIVRGDVYDSYCDPIPNATVTFAQSGWAKDSTQRPVYSVVSDAAGKFKITLTGYKKKFVRYQDNEGKWHTKIERGEKIKGSVTWKVNAAASGKPTCTDTFTTKTGYEENYDICLAKPDEQPRKTGVIEAYVPWTAKSHFPGWLTYPELNAYAWYGLFAAGVTADFQPANDKLITLHVGVQGLAYEMHAVSGKISGKPKAGKKMGWTKWGKKAWSLGTKLFTLKETIENEPDDTGVELPTVYETACETLKENIHLGPTLFIPGVDKHKTSVRVDLIQIISTSGDNKDDVLWSDKQQWFSHDSRDDDSPNTHLKHFRLPKNFNRKKVKVVVYLKLQKLLMDGRTPDGLVPFYTNQHVKLVWYPGNNKLKAYYEPEFSYLKITGLSFE